MTQNIYVVEFLAVLAAAISGILEARNKKMDIVGVFFVGLVTALGGGTVRDLLINRHPVFWMGDDLYPLSIFILALLSLAVIKKTLWTRPFVRRSILTLDAIALGLFSIVGAQYALDKECALSVCVIMGVITGTFGGVIRDILCNEIPSLFRSSQPLYATCSFFGIIIFLALCTVHVPREVAGWIGTGTIIIFRMITIRLNLHLPERLT